MNESWIDELEAVVDAEGRIEPTAGFRSRLRADLSDEWNGRPVADRRSVAPSGDRRPRRGWLLAAAAASAVLVAGLVVATRPDDRVVTPPATDPTTPMVTTEPDAVDPAPTTVLTTTPATTVPDSTTPTTVDSGDAAIVVPLDPTTPVPVEPFATVGYGTGPDQIEVLNGEFPPPAVLFIGGVLVLEDAPQSGLTGRGVIVEGGTGDVVQEVAFNDLEAGGTPIAVRSFDGGVVIVTVHDEAPRVRIRRYTQNPPGEFNLFGDGADVDALGDSDLRITSEGATWGGDVVIPSDPAVARPAVEAGFAGNGTPGNYVVTRPVGDGTTAKWTLEVVLDTEFPPLVGEPLVEPFGDGVLFSVPNSSAQFAQAPLVLMRSDFTADVYDLGGWALADVRPDGALLTRSSAAGLELGLLRPEATGGPESFASPLADWPAPTDDDVVGLADLPYLLPAVDIPGTDGAVRSEYENDAGDGRAHVQSWFADDGSGYLVIASEPDRPDFTPTESRTPVDVPGWDDAYRTRTADGFVSIVLVDGAGHVNVRTAGIDADVALGVARSLERIGRTVPGWTFDTTSAPLDQLVFTGVSDSSRTTFRSLKWLDATGTIIAELNIGSNTDEIITGTFPFSPGDAMVSATDVGGRFAILSVSGDVVRIAWTISPHVAARIAYVGSVEDALASARSLGAVDEAVWTASTALDAFPNDGCDSLFC